MTKLICNICKLELPDGEDGQWFPTKLKHRIGASVNNVNLNVIIGNHMGEISPQFHICHACLVKALTQAAQ